LTHWKKHWPGPVPLPTQSRKQATFWMQLGLWKQPMSCEQHVDAMQSPQTDPSDGHWKEPQTKLLHSPLQQLSGSKHGEPSGEQAWPQIPPSQLPLQQSPAPMHGAPSGAQGSAQTPPAQLPLQQSPAPMHAAPFGWQVQGWLQIVATSFTQMPSQNELQQNGSVWQMSATQGSQPGASASPSTHLS
jgi:hypothetical protein